MNRISLNYLAVGMALVGMVMIAASWINAGNHEDHMGCTNPRRGGVEALFLDCARY